MFAIEKIEEIIQGKLYAVKCSALQDDCETEFGDINEFGRLFNLWQDTSYLFCFFNRHLEDLKSGFFGVISVEEAILITINEAYNFEQELLSVAKNKINTAQSLREIFRPLSDSDKDKYPIPLYLKSKAYGSRKSWLRLYALRLNDNIYIITGGGIKLTRTMNTRIHLKNELKKLDILKQFLIDQGIVDYDGMIDFIELNL